MRIWWKLFLASIVVYVLIFIVAGNFRAHGGNVDWVLPIIGSGPLVIIFLGAWAVGSHFSKNNKKAKPATPQ